MTIPVIPTTETCGLRIEIENEDFACALDFQNLAGKKIKSYLGIEMLGLEKQTREIDALESEGFDGVLECLGGVHAEIVDVLLHHLVEGLL